MFYNFSALGENLKQESQKFKDSVKNSLCSITDDKLNFIKKILQGMVSMKNILQDRKDYLQLLYTIMKHLFNNLSDFADEKSVRKMDRNAVLNKMSGIRKLQFNMCYLEWPIDQCREDTLLERSQKVSSTFLLTTFQAAVSPALKTAPIVLTFMMWRKHCFAFLEFVETDDGQIAASHKQVAKLINNGKVITVGNE